MSSSSRESIPPPLELHVQRERASTKALLGSDYEEIVSEACNPPQPGDSVEDFNVIHLHQALQYADTTLRDISRKLSPIGHRAVSLYKEAVATLLEAEKRAETGELDEPFVTIQVSTCDVPSHSLYIDQSQ